MKYLEVSSNFFHRCCLRKRPSIANQINPSVPEASVKFRRITRTNYYNNLFLVCFEQVHGRLCAAELLGEQDGVLQHVRAADPERPVRGLDAQGRTTDDAPRPRPAHTAQGLRTKVHVIDGMNQTKSDLFLSRMR